MSCATRRDGVDSGPAAVGLTKLGKTELGAIMESAGRVLYFSCDDTLSPDVRLFPWRL